MTIRYFAYGSNISPEQMKFRCPGAQIIDVAYLDNWRFHINTRGSASIMRARDSRTWGILWNCAGAHIATLDEYEGVGWRNYRKDRVEVVTRNGRTQSALVYISPRTWRGRARPNYMLREIISPARKHGFPVHYLKELENWLPHYARGDKMHRAMERVR